jgi:2-oxoisovalerate dehydrogenase E1 component
MALPVESHSQVTIQTAIHPAFDWRRVAYLALLSRAYQFSARGHELGPVLLSQLLDRAHDAATVYYRSGPLCSAQG